MGAVKTSIYVGRGIHKLWLKGIIVLRYCDTFCFIYIQYNYERIHLLLLNA